MNKQELFKSQLELKAKVEAIQKEESIDFEALKTATNELNTVNEKLALINGANSATSLVGSCAQMLKTDEAEFTEDGRLEFKGGDITAEQAKKIGTKEYTQAFEEVIRKGLRNASPAALKSLSGMNDADGGFLVPTQVQNEILQKRHAPTDVLNFVTRLQATSRQVSYPTVPYTASDIYPSAIRMSIVAEGAGTEITTPSFGQKNINIYDSVGYTDVPKSFLEDVPSAAAWLVGELMDADRQNKAYHVIAGPGNPTGPTGLTTTIDATGGITSITSTLNDSFDFDDIVGLSLALPEQYADNAVWLMNRASGLKTVATMVGLDGQPIFRRGGVGNGGTEPVLDTIYGYRVVTSAHMPSIGNGTFPVIFGDLSGVLLAESTTMSVLIDEVSQASSAKTRFVGRTRFGCDVIRPHYLRALKCQ
jgi:HK97 family phage major capsid protein